LTVPKGKTNAPLNILVTDTALYNSPAMVELIRQGHHVEDSGLGYYDRIYGPNCHRMTPELLPFLPLSLKQARLEKKTRGTKAE